MALVMIDPDDKSDKPGVIFEAPIEGVPADEVAHARAQIEKAAVSQGGGGPLIASLNRAYSYEMLYDEDGELKRGPDDVLGKFRKFVAGKHYDQHSFGELAKLVLQDSDFRLPDGHKVPRSRWETHARNTHPAVKHGFTTTLRENLSSEAPLPMFFFIGSSGMRKADDKALHQHGFRLVKTKAKGIGSHPDRVHLVLGILCATDSVM